MSIGNFVMNGEEFDIVREAADEGAEGEVLHVGEVFELGKDVGLDVEGDGAFGGAARDGGKDGVGGDEFDVASVVGGGDAYFEGHGFRGLLACLLAWLVLAAGGLIDWVWGASVDGTK